MDESKQIEQAQNKAVDQKPQEAKPATSLHAVECDLARRLRSFSDSVIVSLDTLRDIAGVPDRVAILLVLDRKTGQLEKCINLTEMFLTTPGAKV